jgi:hypothetical protein
MKFGAHQQTSNLGNFSVSLAQNVIIWIENLLKPSILGAFWIQTRRVGKKAVVTDKN